LLPRGGGGGSGANSNEYAMSMVFFSILILRGEGIFTFL
jgi:hypothetical protein